MIHLAPLLGGLVLVIGGGRLVILGLGVALGIGVLGLVPGRPLHSFYSRHCLVEPAPIGPRGYATGVEFVAHLSRASGSSQQLETIRSQFRGTSLPLTRSSVAGLGAGAGFESWPWLSRRQGSVDLLRRHRKVAHHTSAIDRILGSVMGEENRSPPFCTSNRNNVLGERPGSGAGLNSAEGQGLGRPCQLRQTSPPPAAPHWHYLLRWRLRTVRA